jgi:(E)-4-hydroxy-3-methyl-but-2-enyl pyrophosphate reductase
MVEGEILKGERMCSLGPLIHNPQYVDRLKTRGVRVIDSLGQNDEKLKVIIRSHGVGRKVYKNIEAMKLSFIDATCPFVERIHRLAESFSPQGLVIVLGDKNHPEVKGIAGHCRSWFIVLGSHREVADLPKDFFTGFPSVMMLSQTTFRADEWRLCADLINRVCTNAQVFDTICSATSLRQREAKEIASICDIMVVVGGHHSSNTAKLADICKEKCPVVAVETADDLRKESFMGFSRVGVTAGASTPPEIIKEVRKTMSEILEHHSQEELSFEEMLDQSFRDTYNGEKVKGIVTGISPNEISVDIGTKHAGYVPLAELTEDPMAKPEDIVNKGDEIELLVVRVNDVEGTVMLSKRRLDAQAGFEKVMGAADTEEILDGVVTDVIKGGLLALTNGVKVFIPASHATASRGEPLEDLLRKEVRFKILEVNRQRRRAVGSIRAVIRDERKKQEEAFWSQVEIGNRYSGRVKSMTDYGAFIDLGGVDGMVHVSELSWSKIRHPSQIVSIGDQIDVVVKDLDPEKKKISLGYKKDEDNPWEILRNNYSVGKTVSVKIVSLTAFGAFAEILPGIDGLIHISQMSLERVNKPSDVFSVGDVTDVRITEIDFERRRISLSLRALLEEASEKEGREEADIEAGAINADQDIHDSEPALQNKAENEPDESETSSNEGTNAE